MNNTQRIGTWARVAATVVAVLQIGFLFGFHLKSFGSASAWGSSGNPGRFRAQSPGLVGQGPRPSGGTSPGPVLASTRFDLIGLNVTAGPVVQTVPKSTPTGVATSIRVPLGTDPAQIIAGLNPNYRIRGELSGPSLASPRTVESKIGDPIPIPPLSKKGDHVVRNIRVVDIGSAGAPSVAPVTPDSCTVTVIEQLLVSEVRVRELDYDEIVKAGINVTDGSYRFVNFTLGLATESVAQRISIPVAFPSTNVAVPEPLIGIPELPPEGLKVPAPDVLPVMLRIGGQGDDERFPSGLPEDSEVPAVIPGLIVFPGRIGFLNQFFEAIVIVSNGAPDGSPLVVRNLKAKVRLPDNGTPSDLTDDPLRIAVTQTGGAVTELELHDLGPDGAYGTADDIVSFASGKSAQATFLLEGLKEGLHTVDFDLEGTLDGLPLGPVPVTGAVSGAVLVRDASFAVTFTHPAVVRTGQEYDLAMTVFNTGSRDIQGTIAQLFPNSIVGAELIGADNGQRPFPTTIRKGASGTVKWRLRSNTTGRVTASYVKVGGGVEAGLTLSTGVGDRNVPLSPDSLILPDPVRFLPTDVVDAARALLGQAWSVATTPRYALPEGVKPIDKQVIVDRAVELGIAGLRVEYNEPTRVTLATVLRDWLGELQESPDVGFADAMRDTISGYAWHDRVGEELRKSLTNATQPVTPAQLHRELAEAESVRSPFVSALVTQADGAPVFGAKFVQPDGKQVGFGATSAERFGDLRNGAGLSLSGFDPNGSPQPGVGQLLLVSNPAAGEWTLDLAGRTTGAGDVSLLLPVGGNAYNRIAFAGVAFASGARYRIRFQPFSTTQPVLEAWNGTAFVPTGDVPTVEAIAEPAPRIVGVVQVTNEVLPGGDDYGRLVGILFSKPMARTPAETLDRYRIGGGELIGSNPPKSVGLPIAIDGANLNFNGRFAVLALHAPVGPYIRRDLTVSNLIDVSGLPLSPTSPTLPIVMKVSPQGTPPGGYAVGRTINADGTPVPDALVEVSIIECRTEWVSFSNAGSVTIAVLRSDDQGRFGLDYVVNGECGLPPGFRATHPETNSVKGISTPVVFDGQRLNLDLVFLARGSIEGTVKTNTGEPSPFAHVQVIPTLDVTGAQVVQADAVGKYRFDNVPVGNVSLRAMRFGTPPNPSGFGNGYVEGASIVSTADITLEAVNGKIRGGVRKPDGGPSAQSLVIVHDSPLRRVAFGFAYTDETGNFTISNLPLRNFWVEVVDYVTRVNVGLPVVLSSALPEVSGVLLTLPGNGTVTGRVTDAQGAPIPDVPVRSPGREAFTDANGTYTLQGLPAGPRTIEALETGVFFGATTIAQVQIGQTTNNVNFILNRIPIPGAITGRVFEADGVSGTPRPLGGVVVTYDGINPFIQNPDGSRSPITTDANGNYTLTNVPSGVKHTVRYVRLDKNLAVNLPVEVPPGATVTRDAVIRPATFRGRIFQPDGAPTVAQVKIVTPYVETRRSPDFGLIFKDKDTVVVTQSNADGTYSAGPFMPGSYSVKTSSAFFPRVVGVNGFLRPGEEAVHDLTLVDTLAGKVSGTVFQPDGVTPVGQGVRVTFGGGGLADATVRTDANGYFEFPEVFSEGNYNLTATDPVTGFTNRLRAAAKLLQDTKADIRLLGNGTLRVRVVDGAGNPVQDGDIVVRGVNYPQAQRTIRFVDPGGTAQFDNLPEGDYTISASRQGLSGRGGATVILNGTVEATIQLQNAGTVRGRVLLPGGQVPVGLADVKLALGGRMIGFTISSDTEGAVGEFQFDGVPAGDFTLDVFDNRSGRTGRASGRVVQQGEIVTADVILIPVGAVVGRVLDGASPQGSVTVTISPGGDVSFPSLRATTDSQGRFRFNGIPAGRFQLQTLASGNRSGTARGTVPTGAEPLPETTVDILIAPTGTVTGTVYRLGGTETVAGARVTVNRGGQTFQTTSNENGVYRVDYVPLGTGTTYAEAPTGYDRGQGATFTLTTSGDIATADIPLSGVGTIRGEVRDNTGTLLAIGTVTFTSGSPGPQIVLIGTVQADGRYEIPGAPAGDYSMKLTVPNRVGVGSATGTLIAASETTVNLQLADAGTVEGRVKKPDGVTDAASAKVIVRMTGGANTGATFIGYTDFQGRFSLPNVPLGPLSVTVEDAFTQGVAIVPSATLATNNQVLDVGTLTLDVTAIQVASIDPPDGTTNVSRTPTITITFSEPALASSVNASTIRLLRGTSGIGATVTLSSDGLTAQLQPVGQLSELIQHTVVVSTSVKDRAGLRLEEEKRSIFTTGDFTGPSVAGIDPLNNAIQVPLGKVIRVTYNEALKPDQDFSTVVTLTTSAGPVAGTAVLEGSTVVAFTPTGGLTRSTRYTVTASGAMDLTGNTQVGQAVSTFLSLDETPPTVGTFSIDGTRVVLTARPSMTAALADDASGINPASGVLTLDGVTTTAGVVVFLNQVNFTPAANLSPGAHVVTFRIADNAGNLSALRTATFTIDDVAPTITSFTIAGQEATDGGSIQVGTQRPLFEAFYTDEGPISAQLFVGLQGTQPSPISGGGTGLGYQPPSALADGLYQVVLNVRDAIGNLTSRTLTMTIQRTGPRVDSVGPADNTQNVSRTTDVTITFDRPLRADTVNADTIRLFDTSRLVPVNYALSPDRRAVTLTQQSPPLRNFDQHTVTVLAGGVRDDDGFAIDAEFTSRFTTIDAQPPRVTTITPADGAVNIALNANVVVTFDEALAANQDPAEVVKLKQGATEVPATVSISGNRRTVTLNPTNDLADSTQFTISVNNQRDEAGHQETVEQISTFTTVDRTPPVVNPLSIDGTFQLTRTPTITATFTDNLAGIDRNQVTMTLDGASVTPTVAPNAASANYVPPALAVGPHTVTVKVKDLAGNESAVRSATFTVDSRGPELLTFTIGGQDALTQGAVEITGNLQPEFLATFRDGEFGNPNNQGVGVDAVACTLSIGLEGSQLQQVPANFTSFNMSHQPPGNLANGVYRATLVVTDYFGNQTTRSVQFTLDVTAPQITQITPNTGTHHGGTIVTVTGAKLLHSDNSVPPVVRVGNRPAFVRNRTAAPDTIEIIVPPGLPGAADIVVENDQGTGTAVGGFTYAADARTPFVVEPDTLLLWHLDDLTVYGNTVADSGRTGLLTGNASSSASVVAGRFGPGRGQTYVTANPGDALALTNQDFTLEGWFRTPAADRTYTLLGKSDLNGTDASTSYAVQLTADGALRGLVFDENGTLAQTETVPASLSLRDDAWHQWAFVLDRTAGRIALYADGVERASANLPGGFGALRTVSDNLFAGYADGENQTGNETSPLEFPGAFDEIRISTTAHTAQQIENAHNGTLGVQAVNVSPRYLVRGEPTTVRVTGYNLLDVSATATDPSGAPVTVAVVPWTANEIRLQLTIDAGAQFGNTQVTLTSANGTANFTLPVLDITQSYPAVESDTVLLWNLDEPGDGYLSIRDAGPFGLDTNQTGFNSTAQAGRFGGGRAGLDISISDSGGLTNFQTSDFTLECWVKTDRVGRPYLLVGNDSGHGLYLLSSGAVHGRLADANGLTWPVQMSPTVYDIADNQWHHVALTVNRTTSRAALVVDGIERAVSSAPVGFGSLQTNGSIVAGRASSVISDPNQQGPNEFPGTLDAVRISSTAHASQRIRDEFDSTSPLRAGILSTEFVNRDKTGQTSAVTQVTVDGFNLDGVTARLERNGTPFGTATVDSSGYRQATMSLTIVPNTPLGPAQLVLAKAGQPDSTAQVEITEHRAPTVDAATQLLWRLDETDDGSITIQDSGPNGVSASANSDSRAKPGRFAGGRLRMNADAYDYSGNLVFPNADFSLELWIRTLPVQQTETLVGREDDGNDAYVVKLSPNGTLTGRLVDESGAEWKVVVPRSAYRIDDYRRHAVALVADRANSRLTLYIDGLERAVNPMPSGFGALRNFSGTANLTATSSGTLDEIRISSAARTAAEIAANYFGPDTPAQGAPTVRTADPRVLERGGTNIPVGFIGADLAGAVVSTNQSGVTVTTTGSSRTRVDAVVSVAGSVPRGPVEFTVTGAQAPPATVTLTVADPRPFGDTETGTVLLWHLNEIHTGQGRIYDAGPFGIDAGSTYNGITTAGRFAGGRTRSVLTAASDHPALNFGASSFTVEAWIKTDSVEATYTLVGKGNQYGFDGETAFAMQLTPSGTVRGQVFDESGTERRVEVPSTTYDVTDNQWHLVSLVADRTGDRLALFIDGSERGQIPLGAGFGALRNVSQPFFAGFYDSNEPNTGSVSSEFPGVLDEIRVVNFARAPQQIQDTWLGTDAPTGGTQLVVASVSPSYLVVGETMRVNLLGENLTGISASATASNGDPVTVQVVSSSATSATIDVTVPTGTPQGPAQLSVSSGAGSANRNLAVIDIGRIRPAVENDTVLLWRLDEPNTGFTDVEDAGPAPFTARTSYYSTTATGRFGGGRTQADITSGQSNSILSPGMSGFTVEGWVKTPAVTQPSLLVGVGSSSGYLGGSNSTMLYTVELLPSNVLRGIVIDETGKQWTAILRPETYLVTDDQWHQVVMVCDRASNRLVLYVDGLERASTPMPEGFGSVTNGYSGYFLPFAGPAFPNSQLVGTLDEIRVSSTAHSAQRIRGDFEGTSTYRLTSFVVPDAQRNKTGNADATTSVNVEGYDLSGVTARVERNGQAFGVTTSVVSESYRQARIDVTVPPTVAVGPAQLVLSKSGFADVTFTVNIVEPAAPTVDADTRLLWQLDEAGDGRVTVADAGPHRLTGKAGVNSIARPGRFSGGRGFAQILGDFNSRELEFGASSFTAQAWFKTGPIGRTYTLVGKGEQQGYASQSEYVLAILPDGNLRGTIHKQVQFQTVQVSVETAGLRLTDGKFHLATLVADRQAGRLVLYVDGTEAAFSSIPGDFGSISATSYPPYAGYFNQEGPGSGFVFDFPGTLDAVQISAGARTAAQIQADFLGSDAPPPPPSPPTVRLVLPKVVQRNTASQPVSLIGFGLNDATVTTAQSGVTISVTASSSARLDLSVTTDAGAPLAPLQLTVTDPQNQTTTATLVVVDQQPFGDAEPGTVLLWHLNETVNGSTVVGSGPTPINGQAFGSIVEAGRFDRGRRNINAFADYAGGILDFTSSSFTTECWVKTKPVNQPHELISRDNGFYAPYALSLLPSGRLSAKLTNSSLAQFSVETDSTVAVADDDTWHFVSMVVDRTAGRLAIFVDGVERASGTIPGDFGDLRAGSNRIHAGGSFFPGVLDEIRIMNFARAAAQIRDTWYGPM